MHYNSDVVKNFFEVSKVFSPCLPTKTPLMPGEDAWVLLSFLLCCDSAQYLHARTRSCYLTTAFIRTVKLDIRKTIFVGVFGTKKATASVVRATLSNLYKNEEQIIYARNTNSSHWLSMLSLSSLSLSLMLLLCRTSQAKTWHWEINPWRNAAP